MDEAAIRRKIQAKLAHGALPIYAQAAPEASLYSHAGEGTGNRAAPVTPQSRPTKSA